MEKWNLELIRINKSGERETLKTVSFFGLASGEYVTRYMFDQVKSHAADFYKITFENPRIDYMLTMLYDSDGKFVE